MRRFSIRSWVAVLALLATPALSPTPLAADDGPRVYLSLVEGADIPFADATVELEAALVEAGWIIVARMDCGVEPQACDYRSRVVVAHHPELTERLMEYGTHAAFAVPIRFVVFEDERGVNVGATNPMNLFRTIVDEETSPNDWADVAASIRAVTADAFGAWASDGEYGQERENARIGRTFGIMAGGKFTDKIERVVGVRSQGVPPSAIARLMVQEIPGLEGDWEWGLEPVYTLDLPEHGATVVGFTSARMEAKSFSIVRNGSDRGREDFACPGIAYAAAYPIEVVIRETETGLEVVMVDVMYRMKMFFEDAGKVAFAKNMGMPGSLEGEIKKKVEAILSGG